MLSRYKHMAENSIGSVYVLGVKNFGWNNSFVKYVGYESSLNKKVIPLGGVIEFNVAAASQLGNSYINIMELLMDDGRVPIFTEQGRFITYDTNHLTSSGSRYLGRILLEKSGLSFLAN